MDRHKDGHMTTAYIALALEKLTIRHKLAPLITRGPSYKIS